jgi:hypothetical protein
LGAKAGLIRVEGGEEDPMHSSALRNVRVKEGERNVGAPFPDPEKAGGQRMFCHISKVMPGKNWRNL